MSYESRVTGNPNPQLNCFCGAQRGDCPGGPGFVSPNEVEHDTPGNYANYISDACVHRLAGRTGDEAVAAPAGRVDVATYGGPETDENGAWIAPYPPSQRPAGPPRHENPTGDSLEDAARLLDEQQDDDPVI